MSVEKIEHVAVIGAGEMGQQIALLCAKGGFPTHLHDQSEEALEKAIHKLNQLTDRWVEKGKVTVEEREEMFARLIATTSIEEAVQSADLIIEAVVEKLEVKRDVFQTLDQLVAEHTILATNSSTIVSSKLASVTKCPDRVLNMHFFYPPVVMDCIEIVRNEKTSQQTVDLVSQFCKEIGRTGVVIEKEIFGFIANRFVLALTKEALLLYEGGYADYQDIDLIVKKALGHPLGPFELMDLSGLDVGYYVNVLQYEETGKEEDRPAQSVIDKIEKGELGRKTGKGWYDYTK